MSNRERGGEVQIEADGQTYTLVLDINAMCELEELLSTPEKPAFFGDIVSRMTRGSLRDIRAFLWAGLRRHHKGMTLDDVGTFIVEAGGVAGISAKLQALTRATQADPKDAKDLGVGGQRTARPLKAQPRGTGVNSTSRPDASV